MKEVLKDIYRYKSIRVSRSIKIHIGRGIILSVVPSIVEGNKLISLLETEKLRFTLNLQSGTAINNSTPGDIKLKSKGVFFLNIDNTL